MSGFYFHTTDFFFNKQTKPLSVDLKKVPPYRCDSFFCPYHFLQIGSNLWRLTFHQNQVKHSATNIAQMALYVLCPSYQETQNTCLSPSCDTDLPVLSSDSLILPSFFSSSVFHVMVPDLIIIDRINNCTGGCKQF